METQQSKYENNIKIFGIIEILFFGALAFEAWDKYHTLYTYCNGLLVYMLIYNYPSKHLCETLLRPSDPMGWRWSGNRTPLLWFNCILSLFEFVFILVQLCLSWYALYLRNIWIRHSPLLLFCFGRMWGVLWTPVFSECRAALNSCGRSLFGYCGDKHDGDVLCWKKHLNEFI